MDECTHPVQVAGMCAVCAKVLEGDALDQTSFSMMHSHAGVKVSEEEARRLDSENTAHLISQRKLALVVDLDQTIIHATVDPTVGDWIRDHNNPNHDALSDVGLFKLGIDGKAASEVWLGDAVRQHIHETANDDGSAGCWYYVKPRPGLDAFLRSLSQRYELHVYTMGTRSYADCVCRLVDPDGSIFGNRILSRDENGSLIQKSLSRLFPVDTSMVVIIDDRADVWKWSPNLVKVIPYDFFVGIGDINATFLPALPTLPGASSSDAGKAASGSGTSSLAQLASAPNAGSPSAAADEAPKPTEAVGPSESEEGAEEKPSKEAVALLAAQSQKLEEILSEQRQERPLAKMQEALNEKLGATPASSSRESGTSTPNGDANEVEREAEADTKGKQKAEEPIKPDGAEGASAAASSAAAAEARAAATEPAEPTPTASTSVPPQQDGAPANGHPQPAPQAVLRDDDTELDRIQEILDDIHAKWYQRYDERPRQDTGDGKGGAAVAGGQDEPPKPTVTEIIAARKVEVLKGCFLSFSGMIPSNVMPRTADIWRVAEEYGATCITNLTPSVTHVVAARPGTVKAMRALTRPEISVVWPGWLHDSIARWQRRPETWYLLPPLEGDAKALHANDGWDDPLEGEPGGADPSGSDFANISVDSEGGPGQSQQGGPGQVDGGSMPGFAEMDWAEAADEVDQFLDDDDDDDDDDGDEESEADAESEVESEKRADASSPTTPKKNKRGRTETGSDDENGAGSGGSDNLLLRSPLSKRRKRTEDRMGKSKLKESVTGDELVKQSTTGGGGGGGGGGKDQRESDADDDDEGEEGYASKAARAKTKRASSNGGGGGVAARSRLATPGGADDTGTDTGSIDESFLDDLANEIDLQMGEDAESGGASHSDDD